MDTEKFTQEFTRELTSIEANLALRYSIRDIDSFCKAVSSSVFAKYGNLIRIGRDLQVYHMTDKDDEYVHIVYKHSGGTLNNIYKKSHEASRNPSKLFWLSIYDGVIEEAQATKKGPEAATPTAEARKQPIYGDLQKTLKNFRLYGNL